MSHFTVYKLNVVASENLVADAIRSLAQKINMQAVTEIQDYFGRQKQVLVGLKGESLPSGIGFNVEKGSIVVVGDSFGYRTEFERLQRLAVDYINAYKVALKARMLYPASKINAQVKENMVLLEVNV